MKQGAHSTTIASDSYQGRIGDDHRPLIMLALVIALAILSQFYRSSTGVIAPDIMVDLHLSAEDFGNLSSAFFVVFTLLQIPLGIFLDRFGARRVLSLMMLATIAGSFLFAFGQNLPQLIAGRLMMGFGCAGLMVGSLVVLSRWHSPERFMRVMALLFASANAGSLVATLPLASATAAFGWRGTFVGLGVLCAVLTVLFFAVVRDAPAGASPRTASNATLWATVVDYRRVFDIRDLLYVAPMVAVGYASVITVLGLWGGPYLHDVYGLSAVERGNVLAIMAIAMIAGTLFYGPLDKRFNSRKLVVFGGAAATAVLFLVLAVMPNLPLIATTVLLALISFVGSYSLVTMAHGLALFTGDMAGRGSTTLNLCLMGGAAAIQSATGWVIGVMTSGETGASSAPYAAVFLFLGLVTALALAAYCRAGDIKPASRAK